MENNTTDKIINSLSYLSIMFLPVLFPIIVWLLSANRPNVRHHAVMAFWVHIIPTILIIISVMVIGSVGLLTNDPQRTGWVAVILIPLMLLISLGFYLYNIVKAIKILIA